MRRARVILLLPLLVGCLFPGESTAPRNGLTIISSGYTPGHPQPELYSIRVASTSPEVLDWVRIYLQGVHTQAPDGILWETRDRDGVEELWLRWMPASQTREGTPGGQATLDHASVWPILRHLGQHGWEPFETGQQQLLGGANFGPESLTTYSFRR